MSKPGRSLRSKSEPERAGSLLSKVLSSLGYAAKVKEYELVAQWSEIVGEPIASKTHAVRVSDQKLFVQVESAVWRQELVFHKPALLERINQFAQKPVIKDIIFV